MVDGEEQEIPRSRGKVKWFNDHKGYGFIILDDGSEDLFVHHSSIQSTGFRSLRVAQPVEFHIALENERFHAIHVTAPGGSPFVNNKPPANPAARIPANGRRDRNNNNGGAGANSSYGNGGCYNCGESGHVARECRRRKMGTGGGGGDGGCYNCGDYGHIATDCGGLINVGRGGGDRGCYTCGDYGHIARDCNLNTGIGNGNGNGGGGSIECYSCGGLGHIARECPSGEKRGFSTGGGRRFDACYNCREQGHFARDCPKPLPV